MLVQELNHVSIGYIRNAMIDGIRRSDAEPEIIGIVMKELRTIEWKYIADAYYDAQRMRNTALQEVEEMTMQNRPTDAYEAAKDYATYSLLIDLIDYAVEDLEDDLEEEE